MFSCARFSCSLYSVGKHKGFFLQLLKTLLNDIADPICFETKQFLANII
jgi:hypothetical protein